MPNGNTFVDERRPDKLRVRLGTDVQRPLAQDRECALRTEKLALIEVESVGHSQCDTIADHGALECENAQRSVSQQRHLSTDEDLNSARSARVTVGINRSLERHGTASNC